MLCRSIYAGFHVVGLFTAVTGFSPASLHLGQRPSLHRHPLRCPPSSFSLRSTRTASHGRASSSTGTNNSDVRNLDSPNPWIVLGLKEAATRHVEEIKLRYKHLAMLYHPDRTPNATPAEKQMASDRFAKINSAYQTAKAVIAAKQRNNDYNGPSGHWSTTTRRGAAGAGANSRSASSSSARSGDPFAQKSPFAKKYRYYEARTAPPPPHDYGPSPWSSAHSRAGEEEGYFNNMDMDDFHDERQRQSYDEEAARDFWRKRTVESYESQMTDEDYQSVWSRNGNKGWYEWSPGAGTAPSSSYAKASKSPYASHKAKTNTGTSTTNTVDKDEEGWTTSSSVDSDWASGWTDPHQTPDDFNFRTHGGDGSHHHHRGPRDDYDAMDMSGGGWTQPHQSPDDVFSFRHRGGGPSGAQAWAQQKQQQQQQPKKADSASPPRSRETAARSTNTRSVYASSSGSGGNVSPDLGWTRPHNQGTGTGTGASSASSSSSSPSQTRGREYVSADFWQTCKTVNPGDNKKVDFDDGSFASDYISRFGNVGAAALGGVFEELTHFLDQHLSHDANLNWLFKTGSIEELGQEMDDMQLIAQSLGSIHGTVEKELDINTRKQAAMREFNDRALDEHIFEMERRWKVLTDYKAKAQQRLAAIEHKYWAMVWDQARRRVTPPPPPRNDFPSDAFNNDTGIDGGSFREPKGFGSPFGGLRP